MNHYKRSAANPHKHEFVSFMTGLDEIRRFSQVSMKPVALWEQVVVMATKAKQTVNVDSLNLPLHFNSHRPKTQLKMFGDVLGGQGRAATVSQFQGSVQRS